MKKILLLILTAIATTSYAQCWKTVAVGEKHSLGIQTDGTLWAWGFNGDSGNVGNASTANVLSPVQISTATDWKEISAGIAYSFALKQSGALWAWGSNYYGNLGTGTTAFSTTPVQIGTSTWKMVKAGYHQSVGIKSDGTLWAWGDNQDGNIGDGTFIDRLVPTQISTATNWKSISCNLSRSIAIKEDGTLWVWGFNSPALGVTGMGSNVTHITVPTQVGTDTDWKETAAGNG
ncbi:RCC1 domain-containing protein [Flavobacterium tegetincola]|uniref:RCC1 domain-containing protein n=1 Tax=Flavobacterium tegetincola TaxID=150172 RepID=UPI000427326A|nr:hypothetical protein [Flavobacterium tegetincola]